MKKHLAFMGFLVSIVAIVVVFSCDDGGDPRGQTRNAVGEPDMVIPYEYSTFQAEVWVYAQRDVNLIYEFRRTLGACGGDGQWYLYTRDYANDPFGYGYYSYTLYDPPPTIVHQPVLTAPANHPINISAVVELSEKIVVDTEITGVRLLYKIVGDTLTTEVSMSTDSESDSVFTAQIPAEMVTMAGVEYAVEATSNADRTVDYYWSRVPEGKGKFLKIAVTEDNIPAKISEDAIIGGAREIFGNLPEPGRPSISPMSQ